MKIKDSRFVDYQFSVTEFMEKLGIEPGELKATHPVSEAGKIDHISVLIERPSLPDT